MSFSLMEFPAGRSTSIGRRVAEAFAARGKRRAGTRGGAISDHLLRDIGVTPFGIREAALEARNEARR